MNIQLYKDREQLDQAAARLFIETIEAKPNCVLGLATGSTPLGIYRELVKAHNEGLSFAGTTSFNLDEYIGLDPSHSQSYASYMTENLWQHVDIRPENRYIPNSLAEDLAQECATYDELLASNPIDIQLLGLGHNGHIGFNEPAEELSAGTHIVKLDEQTRAANARFFDSIDEVPSQAVTMGVGSILHARRIVLAAAGADKAEIVAKALQGPITTKVPASLLQLHPNVVVLLDTEAAKLLKSNE